MKKKATESTFKARAKKRGFFGGVYYPAGDLRVFDVTLSQFSSSWMERADTKKKEEGKCKDNYTPLEIPTLFDKYSD